ncbi:MAG: alpha-glucan family phosphorylase, partial [Anaerolineales bacterium]|nr:alpha-glucan family phosphorylase [Anaerolineales bacterium]
RDASGEHVMISVELPGRTVSAQVWTIQVGRITLLMLDTDVDPNAPADRDLAARLYGGDNEMRISQEIILGIGGVRALEAMGYEPTVWHMNEGHSAFLGLERVRKLVQEQHLSFDTAVELVRSSTIFTTHTPVPAGNDAFAFDLVERYFYNYWPQLGIGRDQFLALAHHQMEWGPRFSMTVLALELSARANGVSELHGQVSRNMWKELWPGTPVDEVPISHVTNGVHHPTWTSPALEALLDEYLVADWRDRLDEPEVWAAVREIPDARLNETRLAMKKAAIEFVRGRLSDTYHRLGLGPSAVRTAERILDPNALIIGFARRFATYKRANLIFRDMARITTLMTDSERPIYLLFAGKAHPADEPGKALIREIFNMSLEGPLAGHVIFVEDYDMNVARHMLAGVDIWLNNPRRPLEASGTSGEKAAMNGAPNLSVLDGWWREGYDGNNGWAIGEDRAYSDEQAQDEADALSLYSTLEDDIVPMFYGDDEERAKWLAFVKESIATITPQYNMQRMVKDYTRDLYIPAGQSGQQYSADQFSVARRMTQWKTRVNSTWDGVSINAASIASDQGAVGAPIKVDATAYLNGLTPEDVAVELVVGNEDGDGTFHVTSVKTMQSQGQGENGRYDYHTNFTPEQSGRQAYGIRIRPNHEALINPMETGKVRWA